MVAGSAKSMSSVEWILEGYRGFFDPLEVAKDDNPYEETIVTSNFFATWMEFDPEYGVALRCCSFLNFARTTKMFIRIAVLGQDHVAEVEFQETDTMRNVIERGIQQINVSDISLVGLIVVSQPVQTLYIGDKAFHDMQKGITSDDTPGFSLDNTMES